jgi:hypothetical protein
MRLVNTLSKEELLALSARHETLSGILRELGYSHFGESLKTLKRHFVRLGIPLDKFPTKKDNKSYVIAASIRNELGYETYIEKWKLGKATGHNDTASFKVSGHVRRFLFEKHQGKCEECGWSKRNKYTGKVPLQIHHINGRADDCCEKNLKLLCPNCHSLTDNFGRRNIESVRKHR